MSTALNAQDIASFEQFLRTEVGAMEDELGSMQPTVDAYLAHVANLRGQLVAAAEQWEPLPDGEHELSPLGERGGENCM